MRTSLFGDWRRRDFLTCSALAGAAGLLGVRPEPVVAEPPPETKKLVLGRTTSICQAPQYVAESLLRAEGFTDIVYVPTQDGGPVASGDVQLTMLFTGPLLLRIDVGEPVVLLGGGHIGCLELFGNDGVRKITDLKGKRVFVNVREGPAHIFLPLARSHVGLELRKAIVRVGPRRPEGSGMFEEGKVDAVITAPPVAQEFRARKIGHQVVNTTTDRPWSQYFCCMMAGNR